MLIQLDMASVTPIYVQLRNEIVKGIACGALGRGEELPTVRALAEDLGVNTMTVNKAYAVLKAEGYIEADRRRGARVCRVMQPTQEFRAKLEDELALILAESAVNGIEKQELLALCEALWHSLATPQGSEVSA